MPAENTSKYGTKRYDRIGTDRSWLECANTGCVRYDGRWQGKEKRVLNQQETIAAQAKLEELKTRFDTWLWQDDVRAEHLAQIYNEEFQCVRPSARSMASHLSLPGLSKDFLSPARFKRMLSGSPAAPCHTRR